MIAKLYFAGVCILSAVTLGCSPVTPPALTNVASTWAPLTQQALLRCWVLAEVNGQAVPEGISFNFGSDGGIQGSLTCGNEFQGSYRVLSHTIRLGGRTTERGCDPLALHEAAVTTMFRPFNAYLSSDLQGLHIRGQETLLFNRRRTEAKNAR